METVKLNYVLQNCLNRVILALFAGGVLLTSNSRDAALHEIPALFTCTLDSSIDLQCIQRPALRTG